MHQTWWSWWKFKEGKSQKGILEEVYSSAAITETQMLKSLSRKLFLSPVSYGKHPGLMWPGAHMKTVCCWEPTLLPFLWFCHISIYPSIPIAHTLSTPQPQEGERKEHALSFKNMTPMLHKPAHEWIAHLTKPCYERAWDMWSFFWIAIFSTKLLLQRRREWMLENSEQSQLEVGVLPGAQGEGRSQGGGRRPAMQVGKGREENTLGRLDYIIKM